MTTDRPKKRGRPTGSTFDVRPATASSDVRRAGDSARVVRLPVAASISGGRSLHFEYSHKCKVCNSPWILEITEMLCCSRGYQMILKSLPSEVRDEESEWHLTTRQLRYHVEQGHIPREGILQDALVTDRLKSLGQSIEEMVDSAADHVLMHRMNLVRQYEFMAKNPNALPSDTQVLASLKFFADAEEKKGATLDASAYNTVISVMIEVIKSVAPDRYDEIISRVSENPVLRAIQIQRDSQEQLHSGR
jgi:hypothetical protein